MTHKTNLDCPLELKKESRKIFAEFLLSTRLSALYNRWLRNVVETDRKYQLIAKTYIHQNKKTKDVYFKDTYFKAKYIINPVTYDVTVVGYRFVLGKWLVGKQFTEFFTTNYFNTTVKEQIVSRVDRFISGEDINAYKISQFREFSLTVWQRGIK